MATYSQALNGAKEKLRLKAYAEAEKHLLEALKLDPHGYEAYFILGNLCHTSGKFDRAIEAYKKALKIKPNYTDAALSLSILYNDLGRYEEGRLVFNNAKNHVSFQTHVKDSYLDEKLASKHAELGMLYESYHRFDEAMNEYKKSLALNPENEEIIIKLAKLHDLRGSPDDAIRELQNLITKIPDSISGRIKLGLIYYAQGKIIDALKEWERILDIDPTHKDALMYLEMARKAPTTFI